LNFDVVEGELGGQVVHEFGLELGGVGGADDLVGKDLSNEGVGRSLGAKRDGAGGNVLEHVGRGDPCERVVNVASRLDLLLVLELGLLQKHVFDQRLERGPGHGGLLLFFEQLLQLGQLVEEGSARALFHVVDSVGKSLQGLAVLALHLAHQVARLLVHLLFKLNGF
jgi:hypothetical protein